LQDDAQPDAHQRIVVDDHHPDWRGRGVRANRPSPLGRVAGCVQVAVVPHDLRLFHRQQPPAPDPEPGPAHTPGIPRSPPPTRPAYSRALARASANPHRLARAPGPSIISVVDVWPGPSATDSPPRPGAAGPDVSLARASLARAFPPARTS